MAGHRSPVPDERCGPPLLFIVTLSALALVIWLIFWPANMSPDSISQYRQAQLRQFNTWQSPFIAVCLSVVMLFGGDIQIVSLLQSLAAVFAVYFFVTEAAASFRVLPHADAACHRIGFLATILFVVPYWSPFAFYAMTFWKTTWLAFVLLFWCGITLRLWRNRGPSPGRDWFEFITCFSLTLVVPCIRHNAQILAPILAVAIWNVCPDCRRRVPSAFAGLALVGMFLSPLLVQKAIRARDAKPFNQVMAVELVGLYKYAPHARTRLIHTEECLHIELLEGFAYGDFGALLWSQPRLVTPNYMGRSDRLRAEYIVALREFPLELLKVKLLAYSKLLGIRFTSLWCWSEVSANDYGIREGGWVSARRFFQGLATEIPRHPVLRWLSAVHAVWLCSGIALWIIGATRVAAGAAQWRSVVCVLSVAIAYYASYLVATTAHDFRFMYPATLLVQCLMFALVAVKTTAVVGAGGTAVRRKRIKAEGTLSLLRKVRVRLCSRKCQLAKAVES